MHILLLLVKPAPRTVSVNSPSARLTSVDLAALRENRAAAEVVGIATREAVERAVVVDETDILDIQCWLECRIGCLKITLDRAAIGCITCATGIAIANDQVLQREYATTEQAKRPMINDLAGAAAQKRDQATAING